MSNVAIITARGGSKRIPRKNIKEFCGKPIIAYSIQAALASGCFDEVMVSTDDEEIKEVALEYGAKVPFMRSDETSNDYATTQDVVMEVLKSYRKIDVDFEYACCIYPTAPFITAEKLNNAMKMLVDNKCDTVFPVVPFSFPPQRGLLVRENGNTRFKYPEFSLMRSQDLETIYHDCGQYYCFYVKRFLEEKKIIMSNTYSIIENELEVQDIDNEIDWQLAELKYKLINNML